MRSYLVYFVLFNVFGIGPLLDSLFDFASGDGREIYASVLSRKATFCLLLPSAQHLFACRMSLPLTMLPLPGLLVYAIRCLLSRQWHRIHVVPQFRALSLLYASSLGAMMLCTNRFKVRVRDSARSIVNAVLADSAQGATMGNSNL